VRRVQDYLFGSGITLNSSLLLSSATAGLIIGGLQVFIVISFAAMLFSGPMANYLHLGIGYLLMGSFIFSVGIALIGSNRSAIGIPQEAPVLIMSLMAFEIGSEMLQPSSIQNLLGSESLVSFVTEAGFITVMVAIILTTVMTGAFFLLAGTFKFGSFVRFIPYPVVGGFLVGTGWLITQATFGILTSIPLSLENSSAFFQPEILMRWLPAVGFGLFLLFASKRFQHHLMLPGLIVTGILAFHLVLGISGISLEDAQSMGLLLGPFPEGGIFQPIMPTDLSQVNWDILIDHQPVHIVTIIILSAVALLLNASGIELSTRKNLRLNHELKTAGSINMLAGVFSCTVGFPSTALSILSHKLGGHSRLVGLIVALISLVALMWGNVVLSLLPRSIVGGLLLFVGLSLLLDWLYDGWFKLSKTDYALVVAILVVVAVYGIEYGIFAGIVMSMILFIIRYSTTNPIHRGLSGDYIHSTAERGLEQDQILQAQGGQVHILKLQGYLFFGTAHMIYSSILKRMNDPQQEKIRYLILDFSRVPDMDSSSEASFIKAANQTADTGALLFMVGLNDTLRKKLKLLLLASDEGEEPVQILENLDDALHWCEDQILEATEITENASAQFDTEFIHALSTPEMVERFKQHLETLTVNADEVVIQQGSVAENIYFVLDGHLEVLIEVEGKSPVRVRTMQPGAMFGEMAIYLEQPRSATIKTTSPTTLYKLKESTLQQLWSTDTELAKALNHYFLKTLAKRLVANNRTIENLMQ